MNWLKTVVATLLLALWMPATMCCALERAGVPFFQKCCLDDGADDAPQAPCTDKECCKLEAGGYTTEITPTVAVMPLDVVALVPWALDESPQCPLPGSDFSDLVPPELLVSWQFSFRAAASPRAPSPVS